MSHYEPKDAGGADNIVYTGAASVMPLRGQTAQLLKLQSDGPIALTWAPTDKRATDLEIRMQIQTIAADGDIVPPVVRWHMQLGHGQYVWNQPPLSAPFAGAAPVFADYILPARGAVLRMSTRELTIRLRQSGKVDLSAAYASIVVSVSFLPCIGMRLPTFAQSDYAQLPGVVGLPCSPFPMEANEFRVFNDHGLPFAAGPTLYFVGVLGETYGPYPLASYGAFTPIPVLAIGFISVDVPAWSAYR